MKWHLKKVKRGENVLTKPKITICYTSNFHQVKQNLNGMNAHRKIKLHDEEEYSSVMVSEEYIVSRKIPVTKKEAKILKGKWDKEGTLAFTMHLRDDDDNLFIIRPEQ